MKRHQTKPLLIVLTSFLFIGGIVAESALAQDGRPTPQRPPVVHGDSGQQQGQSEQQPPDGDDAEARGDDIPGVEQRAVRRDPQTGRRVSDRDQEEVKLTFNNVAIEQFFPFIAESTGKLVVPSSRTLEARNITVIHDEWVNRARALDYIFEAFRLQNIGVIETEDMIIIDTLERVREFRNHPVIPSDEPIMHRTDRGQTVLKVFKLEHTAVSEVSEHLGELPQGSSQSVDPASNQLLLLAPVSVAQHVQRILDVIDVEPFGRARTRVFRLRYADAVSVSENIETIFAEAGPRGAAGTPQTPQQRAAAAQRARQQQQQTGTTGVAAIEPAELRVTTNAQQNALIVQADMSVIDKIEEMIYEHLDLPISPHVVKTYDLTYIDPIQARELLQSLLTGSAFQPGTQRPGAARAPGQTGGAEVTDIIGRIYNIQAYPDSQRLVVIAKTPDTFPLLDRIIESIDTPIDPGLPMVIQLRHVDAEELAEQLNALLAHSGANVTIRGQERGLQGAGGRLTGGEGAGAGVGNQQARDLTFPWQTARPDEQADPPLAGKVRIVPIARQNAVALLGPPEYREAIRRTIEEDFDRPARQVMISVVIAEVRLTEAMSLGLRFSSFDIGPDRPDTAVLGTAGFAGSREILGGLFDTAVLDVGVDLNVLLQALKTENAIRIIQQPRIFTADNQQANFFDGQELPFLRSTQQTEFAGFQQTFDRSEVGIELSIRPRITRERHVDMDIFLELANVAPGDTPFGGFIVDRRRTETKLIVKDGQTIVMSGILQEQESEVKRKIPLLGDIPILGALFTSRDTSTTQSELVAFITPTVVESPDENDENFNVFERERLRQMTLPLREQRRRFAEGSLIEERRLELEERLIPQEAAPAAFGGDPNELHRP